MHTKLDTDAILAASFVDLREWLFSFEVPLSKMVVLVRKNAVKNFTTPSAQKVLGYHAVRRACFISLVHVGSKHGSSSSLCTLGGLYDVFYCPIE